MGYVKFQTAHLRNMCFPKHVFKLTTAQRV